MLVDLSSFRSFAASFGEGLPEDFHVNPEFPRLLAPSPVSTPVPLLMKSIEFCGWLKSEEFQGVVKVEAFRIHAPYRHLLLAKLGHALCEPTPWSYIGFFVLLNSAIDRIGPPPGLSFLGVVLLKLAASFVFVILVSLCFIIFELAFPVEMGIRQDAIASLQRTWDKKREEIDWELGGAFLEFLILERVTSSRDIAETIVSYVSALSVQAASQVVATGRQS